MSESAERNSRRQGLFVVSMVFVFDLFRLLARSFAKLLFAKTANPDTPFYSAEKKERAVDRSEDIASGSDLITRQRWGMLFVLLAFVVSIGGGIGFFITYWTNGNNLLLGGTLALFLGGLGFTLVLWAHWLMLHRQATGPREILPSTEGEREALVEDFRTSAREVQRRTLLKSMITAAIGLFAAMAVSLLRALGAPPGSSLYDTVWRRGQRLMTIDGKPVSIDSLHIGSSITVFPEGSIGDEKAQTVLIRVDEHFLQLPEERTNWAPMGYLAYSRVCTHAGCPVGLFEATTDLLLCPCHQSTFNVLKAAQPTSGPAARPLPQLPLYADNTGNLRAGGGFTEPPGPGFWGMP